MSAFGRLLAILTSALVTLGLFELQARAADLTPQQQRAVLGEALQSYDRGISMLRGNPGEARSNFQDAAQKFQLIVDQGVHNGVLEYNLANAFFQAGDIGRAILHYRRAQRLVPSDARLQSNLEYARTLCKTPIASSGRKALAAALLSWHDRMSTRARFTVFIAAWLVFWLALLARILRGSSVWLFVAAIAGTIWLAFGASTALDAFGWGHSPGGVILSDNVSVRKGNGSGFEPQFAQALGPGVEFQLLEHRGDWYNIQLPNGSSGWIESRQAELVP